MIGSRFSNVRRMIAKAQSVTLSGLGDGATLIQFYRSAPEFCFLRVKRLQKLGNDRQKWCCGHFSTSPSNGCAQFRDRPATPASLARAGSPTELTGTTRVASVPLPPQPLLAAQAFVERYRLQLVHQSRARLHHPVPVPEQVPVRLRDKTCGFWGPEFAKFPVKFPVSREFGQRMVSARLACSATHS
jgi:hypothetical protein